MHSAGQSSLSTFNQLQPNQVGPLPPSTCKLTFRCCWSSWVTGTATIVLGTMFYQCKLHSCTLEGYVVMDVLCLARLRNMFTHSLATRKLQCLSYNSHSDRISAWKNSDLKQWLDSLLYDKLWLLLWQSMCMMRDWLLTDMGWLHCGKTELHYMVPFSTVKAVCIPELVNLLHYAFHHISSKGCCDTSCLCEWNRWTVYPFFLLVSVTVIGHFHHSD